MQKVSKRATRVVPAVICLGCVAAFLQPAAAQTPQAATAASPNSSPAIETVVVTARKRSEDIQKVPGSVIAINAETLKQAHVDSLEDLSSFATNLNIVVRADNTPDVVMRGVGSFGVVQGVGFYVNGIQQFEGQTVRPIDIASVEILKGPQGTLYGGANIGGAIKYETKQPTAELSGEATVEFGGWNARTFEGALSGPIIGDVLLGRISVFYTRDDGYHFDPFLNKTLGREEEKGGRVTLEYDSGPTTVHLYLSGDRLRSQSDNLYYTTPNDHTYTLTVQNGYVPSYSRDLYSPTLQIDHRFDDMILTSLSSYFHSTVDSNSDLDKSPLAIAEYVQHFDKSVWSEELRLESSNDTSAFKWLIGAFAQGIDTYTRQFQNVGLDALDPSFGITGKLGGNGLNQVIAAFTDAYSHRQTNVALFGDATYDLDHWSFEGGLRVAYYHNRIHDTTSALTVSPPSALNLTSGCAPCSDSVDRVEVLPKVSVSYHFSNQAMAYLTVARGFEPADLTDEPVTDPNGITQTNDVHSYKPEYAMSYELGEKSSWFDDRLQLNADVFYVDYSNRLFEAGKFVGQQLATFLENVGQLHNIGAELEVKYAPMHDLLLSGALGITRAKWVGGTTFFDGVQQATVNLGGLTGPNTPDYQATVAANWHHDLGDDLVFGARIAARFFGTSWWDLQERTQQRPYDVVDGSVRLLIGEQWTVAAGVKNLFDERYNTGYYDQLVTGAPFNEADVGAPRQWYVNLTFQD